VVEEAGQMSMQARGRITSQQQVSVGTATIAMILNGLELLHEQVLAFLGTSCQQRYTVPS
jgi:hypothetical protein